jgi:hypothetical protein
VCEAPEGTAAAAAFEEPADSSSQVDREMLMLREQMIAVLALNRLKDYMASPLPPSVELYKLIDL